jgi:hypothetical protein
VRAARRGSSVGGSFRLRAVGDDEEDAATGDPAVNERGPPRRTNDVDDAVNLPLRRCCHAN